MNRLSVICILVLSLSIFIGCNKEKDSMQGHIIFLHIGEQNSSIPTFIFSQGNDTSYLQYKWKEVKNENDGIAIILEAWENYVDSNIEKVPLLVYEDIKKTLIGFNYVNHDRYSGASGSFRVLIKDTNDSITFDMPKGQVSKETMIKIIAIAEKNNLEKTKQRFLRYRDMQD